MKIHIDIDIANLTGSMEISTELLLFEQYRCEDIRKHLEAVLNRHAIDLADELKQCVIDKELEAKKKADREREEFKKKVKEDIDKQLEKLSENLKYNVSSWDKNWNNKMLKQYAKFLREIGDRSSPIECLIMDFL